jgi:hypothetical protein
MKNTNNNNKVLLATVAVSVIALIGLTKMAASIVPMMAIGGSYVAVVILFALAAQDYRVGTKDYSAR